MRPTFFVTSVCHQRSPLFRNPRFAEELVDTLYAYRQQRRFLLHEFVIMHDHLHLIVTPGGTLSLEKVLQFVKGGASFRIGKLLSSRREIWQRSFAHQRIRTIDEYVSFRRYVHENPVKQQLCNRSDEYPFSSANPAYELDPVPEALRG
jgi:putative transposase